MNSRVRRLPILILLLACAAAPRAAATPPPLSPEALHPGQRAIVKTVFQGSAIDSFEAEILGTLDSGRSAGIMVLARATSANAIRTGVAEGMSGSPVYVDGRLVGALSTGFSFTREPIFGITPIAEMLSVLDHPERSRDGDASTGMNGVESSGLARAPRFRGLRWAGDDAEEPATAAALEAASAPATRPGMPARLALPLASAGLNPGALALARDGLAPLGLTVVPGGRAASPSPAAGDLVPGSAVAIDVLRGDLMLTAVGTLTWREGDRLLLFGHPLFQSGDARMPLATATIATIVPCPGAMKC